MLLNFYAFILLVFIAIPMNANAQSAQPMMPDAIKALADEGAQVRYLGKSHGLDGWITIKSGQEQFFYVTPSGEALIMGLLFDKSGKLVTFEQIKALREKEGDTLDLFAMDNMAPDPRDNIANQVRPEFKTPAEQLYSDIESSNWIALGEKEAPHIYTFIDPQCPHCKTFLNDLRKGFIEAGSLQVRIIPVGFREDTRAQAAFLLAAPDPETRWFRHMDGDSNALPITRNINQQGIQRNLSIMQSWKFNATPMTVYRSSAGDVKIIQGRAKNVADVIQDLP
jgi:thiol:disulfide interchange protein DsbG